jgi:hypothetical protein
MIFRVIRDHLFPEFKSRDCCRALRAIKIVFDLDAICPIALPSTPNPATSPHPPYLSLGSHPR